MGAENNIRDVYFFPLGSHSSGLNIAAATSLITGKPERATKILLQTLTQNIRFTLDGSNPTASVGFQLKAGDPPTIINLVGIVDLKVIQEAATASLQFQWGY